MAKSIRIVLSPLLLISYLCGMRIVEFPEGHLRPWFSLSYSLLLWSIYSFFLVNNVLLRIPVIYIDYVFCVWLKLVNTFFLIISGMYYAKKFKDCLKRIANVDDTLEKLGITTDYSKLHIKTVYIILGWFIVIFLLNCGDSIWWQTYLHDIITAAYIPLVINYCNHVNIIDDLIFASTLEYMGLKFDQVNEYLRKLTNGKSIGNRCEIKHTWRNPVLDIRQHTFFNSSSSTCVTWIVMHLHLELHKISREIDTILGIQMTFKMTTYFYFVAQLLHEFFDLLFLETYEKYNSLIFLIICIAWVTVFISQLLLINCMCEKVNFKANVAANFINNVSSPACNIEIYEIIAQLSLKITQAPLKFYGFGFFQFGFKYLYKYFKFILTFLIILVQTKSTDYKFVKNF